MNGVPGGSDDRGGGEKRGGGDWGCKREGGGDGVESALEKRENVRVGKNGIRD